MKNKKLFFIVLTLFALPHIIESKAQNITSSRVPPPECMSVELDGSQTLRSYGTGRNKADAVEQAKKNAVYAVIFQGITTGKAGCNMRPLVSEVNARERYEEYFNIFFMDGGEYLKYVSSEDEKNRSKQHVKTKTYANYAVTVRVLRQDLKKRLMSDNVIK